MTGRRRSIWGWGYEDEGADPELVRLAEAGLMMLLGIKASPCVPAPSLSGILLPESRLSPPASLPGITTDPHERAVHTYGRSYRDVVRALSGDFSRAPDLVAFPQSEAEVVQVLDHCQERRIAVIPYGGGTSVCGGVEPDVGPGYAGTLSLCTSGLGRVLEVDRTSRAARIQAGTLGPAIEAQLRPFGLSLRHYPQSFAFSTLGGWIATRSGGHFATLHTHIDDFVESLRVITPSGLVQTRRLPASGAGPAPERWFIGSEGTLGVITEAWMRLQDRPQYRASASICFDSFFAGARFVRAIAQSGLHPANCRLLDPAEAMLSGTQLPEKGLGKAIALVAFESADHALLPWLARALECAGDHGGEVREQSLRGPDDQAGRGQGAAERWRSSFLRLPYLRDALVRRGLLVETFETAITWDRFESFHQAVLGATREALLRECGTGAVGCRLTHVYPDGAAPYYSVLGPARRGAELAQWAAIKDAATAAILGQGGTTTHHHAVGRDFRPYYERERDEGFARALRATKRALDPQWVLNPGVLLAAEG